MAKTFFEQLSWWLIMKICLIKPSTLHKALAVSNMTTAPLGLAYIAGALKKAGHEVQVIDAAVEGFYEVEKFRFDTCIFGLNPEKTIALVKPDTEIIGFSFMFTNNWPLHKEFVQEARKKFPHAVTIAGGEHVTSVPEYSFETAPGLDYIVLGEGEATLLELMKCIEQKKPVDEIARIAYRKGGKAIVNNFSRRIKRVEDINSIPWPAWDLFPLDKYFTHKITYGVYRGNTLPIMASRGCPYDCTFCSSPQMWGKQYNIRDINDFVDEMQFYYQNYNVSNFDFYDLTAIIYKDWIIKLCDEIIRRGLKITYQIPAGTRSEAIDYEVAKKLYQSGCKNITYAPESGSPKVLKAIRKRVKLSNMLDSIKFSNQVGMNIKLNIIVGFPDETHLDNWKTAIFLMQCSWYGAQDMYPAVFSPYPGSAYYERLAKEGKVNIYCDDYFMQIISSHDLWPGKTYNDKMSSKIVKMYTVILYLAFYGTNFLFRPIRIYRMIKNLITNKHESKAELVISQTLAKVKLFKTQSSAHHQKVT